MEQLFTTYENRNCSKATKSFGMMKIPLNHTLLEKQTSNNASL